MLTRHSPLSKAKMAQRSHQAMAPVRLPSVQEVSCEHPPTKLRSQS
jgi:hypothetical protein